MRTSPSLPGASTGPSANLPRPLDGVARAVWDTASFYGRRVSPVLPVSLVQRVTAMIEGAQRPVLSVTHGTTGDGATLSYAGNDATLRSALFQNFGVDRVVATTPLRKDRLRPTHAVDADATFVEVPLHSAREFARRGWLVLPRWLELDVDLTRPEPELWNARKRETVRAVERSELVCEIAEGVEALREFYHGMYVPTALARHGRQAFVRRLSYVRRVARRGVFVFVRRGGQRVAGLLMVSRLGAARTLDAWLFGVRDGTYAGTTLAREAVYLYAARFARDVAHAERLGLTSAPPLLRGGLLRFKQGWGATMSPALRGPVAVALRLSAAPPSLVVGLRERPLVALGIRGSPHLFVPLLVPAGRDPVRTTIPGVEIPLTELSDLPRQLEQIAIRSAE